MENSLGLSNYLTSNIEMDTVIKESFVENLHIITSGPVSPNPGEILGSDKMRKFLEEMRKRYDRVILDCPPLTGIGDSYVIASLLGQCILVIAAGKTPVDLIRHTQKQIEKSSSKILGIVLSMVDMDKERHGGYSKHYYHTYNRYYDPNG
jgi:capsular exopolysaccharide synthesis family protein